MLEHNYAGPQTPCLSPKDICTVLRAGRFAFSQLLSSHASLHAAAQPSRQCQCRQCQARQLRRSICIPLAATGQALQFALPLKGSTPTATLSLPTASDVTAVAVDSAGNVAVGDFWRQHLDLQRTDHRLRFRIGDIQERYLNRSR